MFRLLHRFGFEGGLRIWIANATYSGTPKISVEDPDWDRVRSASFCRIRIPFNSKQMKKLIQKTFCGIFFYKRDTFDTNEKDKDCKVAML